METINAGATRPRFPLVSPSWRRALLLGLFALAASASSAQFVADDFHACALDPAWTFVNPAGNGAGVAITGAWTGDAHLALSVPGGATHEIWGSVIGAPHVLQPLADTDFRAEVKFASVLPSNFAQEGLFVRQDDSRWLRLEFYRDEAGQLHIAAVDGPTTVVFDHAITGLLPTPLYMQVVRAGNLWTVNWSRDGLLWEAGGPSFTSAIQPTGLGLYAGNRGAQPPAHTVQVDWLRGSIAAADDTARGTLTVGIAGGGQVIRQPDLVEYGCGDVVTVTAVDRPGWIFAGWTGSQAGSPNPVTITMNGPQTVGVAFAIAPTYTLATSTIGGGTVGLSPPGGSYNDGTVVTVTAIDGAGWAFGAWSGALSGTTNPQTLTMNGNRSIAAAFNAVAQHTATTSVQPGGAGTIVLNPPGGTFNHGATATFTAVPAPGWSFTAWSGALGGSANPATLVIAANVTVAATFAALPSRVLTTTVTGNGRIAGNPDLPSYPAGSTIALTAVPDSGWQFSAWGGDLSGTASPSPLVMDADKSVHATFAAIPPVFVADDFNECALAGQWVAVDPLGDGGVAVMDGGFSGDAHLAISVPGSVEHEIWNGFIGATHVLQPARNVDFTIEAKFDADLPADFAQQGILIKESELSWVRAEVFRDDVGLLRIAVDRGPSLMTHDVYLPAGAAPPFWMRVSRSGDTFVQSWSTDGTNWTVAGGPFTYAMNVTAVGVFAGNRGSAPPAHTVLVDYVNCRTGAPAGEDGGLAGLVVTVDGGGAVSLLRNLANYPCGETEQLTAVAGEGWVFAGWGGQASGRQNPLAVTMSGTTSITAMFRVGASTAPGLPTVTLLRQNTPNPFNPLTVVPFELARPGPVLLQVYGLDGRLLRVLAEGSFAAGSHSRAWDGCDEGGRRLGSGVYLVRLATADGVINGRMVMVK